MRLYFSYLMIILVNADGFFKYVYMNIRYGFLLSEDNACQDPLSISVAVLQQFDVLPDMYQVGYTKLYFRTGQVSSYICRGGPQYCFCLNFVLFLHNNVFSLLIILICVST